MVHRQLQLWLQLWLLLSRSVLLTALPITSKQTVAELPMPALALQGKY